MKKNAIFAVFLMIFSIFCLKTSLPALAQSSYSLSFSSTAQYEVQDSCLEVGNNFSGYILKAYSLLNTSIDLTASLMIDGQEMLDDPSAEITWKDAGTNQLVTAGKTLVLEREDVAQTLQSLIYNTASDYVKSFTITIDYEINGANEQVVENITVTVLCADPNANNNIITLTPSASFLELPVGDSGLPQVTKKSGAFRITAKLRNEEFGYNWYLKTANSSTYDLYATNTKEVSFAPSALVSNQNGFGVYKLYAAYHSIDGRLTSQVIAFEVVSSPLNPIGKYTIDKENIPNTKAQLEAFRFSLSNAGTDALDFKKIIWFINDKKVAIGESFTYEPTSGNEFTVSVKYDGATLATPAEPLSVTPASTGIWTIVLIGVGAVALLSLVFGISVKILNKKRDVTW